MDSNLYSLVSCPHCNFRFIEEMPENQCVLVIYCKNCKKDIRPLKGQCCVFCSWGSQKCPSADKS